MNSRYFNSRFLLLLIAISLGSSLGYQADASEVDASIAIGISNSGNLFGYSIDDEATLKLATDLHYKAISVHADFKKGSDFEHKQVELAYTYALEKLYVTGGVGVIELSGPRLDLYATKLFVEIEGRQEILGLIPELHFSKSVNKSSLDHLNLRLGKELYEGRFVINPYAEFAMGSIYSDNFKSNNFAIGVDVITPIGNELYFSPNIAMNFPLDSVKEFDGDAETSIEIGLALKKGF